MESSLIGTVYLNMLWPALQPSAERLAACLIMPQLQAVLPDLKTSRQIGMLRSDPPSQLALQPNVAYGMLLHWSTACSSCQHRWFAAAGSLEPRHLPWNSAPAY